MSAFSYCIVCGASMRKSDIWEVMANTHDCPYGHANRPNVTRDDIMMDLLERVERLEEKLKEV